MLFVYFIHGIQSIAEVTYNVIQQSHSEHPTYHQLNLLWPMLFNKHTNSNF